MAIRIDGTNTTANPGITGADADTGLQFGTDEVKVVTGGSTAVTVDSSQRVGIGTTTVDELLHIEQNVNNYGPTFKISNPNTGRWGGKIDFESATGGGTYTAATIKGDGGGGFGSGNLIVETAGSERCRVDGSGRLLVNISSPIETAAVSSKIQAATSVGAFLILARNDTTVSDGASLGGVRFFGNDSNGTYEECAIIVASADGTHGTGDKPTRLTFSTTADGASTPTERMRITSDGVVKIGADFSSSPSATSTQFVVRNGLGGPVAEFNRTDNVDATFRNLIRFMRGSTIVGQINVSNTATQYNTSSDYRLKENITSITDGITRLKQLNPSRFNFIINPDNIVDGFLAHEVQSIVPEAVSGEKDAVDEEGNPEYQGIDQSKLVPLLTAALQEAIAKIETLEAKVTALEGGQP